MKDFHSKGIKLAVRKRLIYAQKHIQSVYDCRVEILVYEVGCDRHSLPSMREDYEYAKCISLA